MATMNNQKARSWEVRLGLLQVVLIVGLITGSMLAAFSLGFKSGQDTGLDLARQASTAELPRLSITGEEAETEDLGDTSSQSQVYAKLNDSSVKFAGALEEGTEALKGAAATEKLAHPSASSVVSGSAVTGSAGKDTAMKEGTRNADAAQLLDEPVTDKNRAKQEMVRILGGEETAPQDGDSLLAEPVNKFSAGEKLDISEESKTVVARDKEDTKTLGNLLKEKQGSADVAANQGMKAITEQPKKIAVVPTAVPTVSRAAALKEAAAKEAAVKEAAKQKKEAEKNDLAKKDIGGKPLVQALPRGWFVQLAAPKSSDEAEAMARKLRATGFSVMIERAEVRGDRYFRVVVGPERSREMAERLSGQIKRESSVKSDPFIRLVK